MEASPPATGHPLDPGSDGTTAPAATVATVTLRLPEFWPADPTVWFAQVEAQFATHHINTQVARFNYVVAALPPAIAMEVRDIILNRPLESPYNHLKATLIGRTSASERRRLQELLSNEDLGDRKPTQMLRKMELLLGDKAATFDAGLLRELFLQRLPSNVRMILASATETSLQSLAEMADRILEVATPSIAAVSSASLPDEVAQLRADVANLTKLVQELTTDQRRFPSPLRHRRRSPARRSPSPGDSAGVCWYHRRFGDRSTRCTTPCSYAQQEGNAPPQH